MPASRLDFPTFMPQRRLTFALAVSLLLHALLIALGSLELSGKKPPPSALLVARLSPTLATSPSAPATMLKNTLDDVQEKSLPALPPRKTDGVAAQASIHAAQRKLSAYQFYPAEAAARGLEGEVRLLLTLDKNGDLVDIRVASSSGHAILDEAAVRAAEAMHNVPNAAAMEMILPVVFRLE
jgi:protein TonB